MKRLFIVTTLLGCFVIISGCSHHSNTQARTITQTDLVPINADQSVSVLNAAIEEDDVRYYKAGVHSYYVNLHDMTDSAVGSTQEALKGRNIKIADNADKKLMLSIINVSGKATAWTCKMHVTLQVKTGSGLVKTYTRNHPLAFSTWENTGALEIAMSRCIVEMLTDEEIIRYLEN